MTAHRHRFLFARSRSGAAPEALVQGHFDLALFAPSWDNRSASITSARSISIDTSVVLKFAMKDEYGIQDRHEATLDAFLREKSSSSILVQGDALDLPGLWSQLWDTLSRVADTFDHPLRVLVDLSTCPRYYSLGAIAGILRHGIASSVYVFYAEGVYKEPFGSYTADFPFTTGKWLATAIPFLRGTPDPLKGKSFIVSVGFEGIKTARVLAREDPDSVALLFPDPGVLPEYVKQTRERNSEIVEQYRIASDHISQSFSGRCNRCLEDNLPSGPRKCHRQFSILSLLWN